MRTDWAVAGDFNGDDSPDLVAPARPIEERLTIINADTANWILQDPSAAPLGPETDPPPAPVVRKGDMLLAVVHGLGASGWRDPQARQAYLLTVSLEGRITMRKREALLARVTRSEQRLPRLRGDLLYEDARARFLYWTGARYSVARRKPPIRADPPPTSSGGSGPWSCLRPSAAATIGHGEDHLRAPALARGHLERTSQALRATTHAAKALAFSLSTGVEALAVVGHGQDEP